METHDYSIPQIPLTIEIARITDKRDYEALQLKYTIELNFSDEVARNQLEEILKLNKELKILEDQLISRGK